MYRGKMIDYPNELDKIFDKLKKYHIKPIIVGGYIRDSLLHRASKDIDIELYGVESFEKLEALLVEFGEVNSVGRSFGVCKLNYKDLELDFSLPREDSKIAQGHKGFQVTTDAKMEFATAASRRDFTINSLGYDLQEKKLLDPFGGLEDLEKKLLRATDLSKFAEDPLRVLRAVGFATRFDFVLDEALFLLCQKMFEDGALEELALERVYDEIKKLLLKSKKPSIALTLLQQLHGFVYFQELALLKEQEWNKILQALDIAKRSMPVMLALLSSQLQDRALYNFLYRVTNKQRLIKDVCSLLDAKESISLDNFHTYDVYKLATLVDIELFGEFLSALYLHKKEQEIDNLLRVAKELGVLHKAAKALLQGRDLIELGLKPSKKFSQILKKAYEAQMHQEFSNHTEAVLWLKKNINSF